MACWDWKRGGQSRTVWFIEAVTTGRWKNWLSHVYKSEPIEQFHTDIKQQRGLARPKATEIAGDSSRETRIGDQSPNQESATRKTICLRLNLIRIDRDQPPVVEGHTSYSTVGGREGRCSCRWIPPRGEIPSISAPKSTFMCSTSHI